MFDLNESIANWRRDLGRGGACYDRDIDEMESHLREEVEHLVRSGLSEEEAFLLARHRLGDVSALNQEFAKVNLVAVWRDRIFWAAAGILALKFVNLLAGAGSMGCFLGLGAVGVRGTALSAAALVSQGLIIAVGVLGCALLWTGKLPRMENWLAKRCSTRGSRIKVAVLVLIPAWVVLHALAIFGVLPLLMIRHLGMQEFGQYQMAVMWLNLIWPVLGMALLVALMMCACPRTPTSVEE